MSEELAVYLPANNFLTWPRYNTYAPRAPSFQNVTSLRSLSDLDRLPKFDIHDREPVKWKINDLNFEIGAAAADGLAAGMYSFETFRAIDPAFLKAIEFSTADHIHGLTSVSGYIGQHFFDVGDASAEGWLYRLQGYVGEQTAAAAFEAAGHVVKFPYTPNFPGIDMYVDGVPWQVKQGVDAVSQVRDFAASHGSIEVATTPEAAAHFHDAQIHAFPNLDPDVVSDLTNHSIGGLHEGFHPNLHLPLLTIAVSSFREIRLLIDEKTSIQRALAHVGMDAAGVAGGGWAGAKVGALLVAPFTPVGAAIGAVVGGIIGAIAGKKIATAFRYSNFNDAKENYIREVTAAEADINRQITESKANVYDVQVAAQKRYSGSCELLLKRVNLEIGELVAETVAARSNLAHKFVEYLADMKSAVERQHLEARAKLPFRIAGFLIADRDYVWRLLVDKWFAHSKATMSSEIARYSQLKIAGAANDALLANVDNFVTTYIFEHQPFVAHTSEMTTRFERAKVEANSIESMARQEAEVVKRRLLSEIAVNIDYIQNKIVATIQSWKSLINSALERMREEGRPVGIEIAGAGL